MHEAVALGAKQLDSAERQEAVRTVADAGGQCELAEAVGTTLALIVESPNCSEERPAECEQGAYEARRPSHPVSQEQRSTEEGRK